VAVRGGGGGGEHRPGGGLVGDQRYGLAHTQQIQDLPHPRADGVYNQRAALHTKLLLG
jgi:hypothetical protein